MLSAGGKYQAYRAGLSLKKYRFDHIFASDLTRAIDTAEIIAKNNVHYRKPKVGEGAKIVETSELLRERSFGVFEMRPRNEFVAAAHQAGFSGEEDEENIYNFKAPGGEGILDVRGRAVEFLGWLGNGVVEKAIHEKSKHGHYDNFNILVVSHGGWLRQLSHYLFRDCKSETPPSLDDMDNEDKMYLLDRCVGNTAISHFRLQIDSRTAELVSVCCKKFACVEHLQTSQIIN